MQVDALVNIISGIATFASVLGILSSVIVPLLQRRRHGVIQPVSSLIIDPEPEPESVPDHVPESAPVTIPRPLSTDQKVEILYQASLKPNRSQAWNLVWSLIGIVSGYVLGSIDPLHLTHH